MTNESDHFATQNNYQNDTSTVLPGEVAEKLNETLEFSLNQTEPNSSTPTSTASTITPNVEVTTTTQTRPVSNLWEPTYKEPKASQLGAKNPEDPTLPPFLTAWNLPTTTEESEDERNTLYNLWEPGLDKPETTMKAEVRSKLERVNSVGTTRNPMKNVKNTARPKVSLKEAMQSDSPQQAGMKSQSFTILQTVLLSHYTDETGVVQPQLIVESSKVFNRDKLYRVVSRRAAGHDDDEERIAADRQEGVRGMLRVCLEILTRALGLILRRLNLWCLLTQSLRFLRVCLT